MSHKTGPLLLFQLTPTILVQYQQILAQRIVIQSALNGACHIVRNLQTEYQLRFSCGTHSRGNCAVILQQSNVRQSPKF